MPTTKHKLSRRIFQFPKGTDENTIKGVKCQEFVLSEQDPALVAQLLKILEIPPAPISMRDWTRFRPKERGIIYDDREASGPVPLYFVQLLPGNGVVHIKPL